jgi:hypothetical protein
MSAVEAVTERPPAQAKKRPRLRSAVTSGRKKFVQGDSNSAWARRFHDLIQGHVSDLGGRSNMSEAQLALAKRAAAIECELEQLEGRLSQGEEVCLDSYGRAASHLRRLLEVLGIERKCRDVTLLDGTVEEVFSPMRWAAAEARAKAAKEKGVSDSSPNLEEAAP